MKKNILMIVVLAMIPVVLSASPPKKVKLSYDEGKLKIVATHPTRDVNDHYIGYVSISVDGQEVKVIKPTKQTSDKAETIEVEIPEIKKGSLIEVKAKCNKFGSKTVELQL